MAGGGGGGLNTPSSGGVLITAPRPKVDPRDPKGLPIRQRMANDISAFLASVGEHVEAKTLLTPTAKDFRQILKSLIGRLDRTYPFAMNTTKGSTQWTEEVVPALKVMMYPFPESITKSHLHAIGSQTSWPNMLAMLHWFVNLIQVRSTPSFSLSSPASSIETTHAHPRIESRSRFRELYRTAHPGSLR